MRAGLTLLEVLVAVAILAVVAAALGMMRLDAIRNERMQREHTTVTQILRSEAESLRAGNGAVGACASLAPELAVAGYVCRVESRCGFAESVCSAATGSFAWVVAAASPRGREASLALLFRRQPDLVIEAQR